MPRFEASLLDRNGVRLNYAAYSCNNEVAAKAKATRLLDNGLSSCEITLKKQVDKGYVLIAVKKRMRRGRWTKVNS